MANLRDVPAADVLRAIDASWPPVVGRCWMKHEALAAFPEKLLLAKARKMEDAGLIESGVSLRFPWLTDAGRARLVAPQE